MARPLAQLVVLLTPKRSWFQFRLRTLFVIVPLAAVPCCWLAWKIEAKRREQAAVAAIRKTGAMVKYTWPDLDWFDDSPLPDSPPPGPGWLRFLAGDDIFIHVNGVIFYPADFGFSEKGDFENATDDHLRQLQYLPWLSELRIGSCLVTDAGLAHLRQLPNLKTLILYGTQVTNAGVSELQEYLPNCQIERYGDAKH
jgi:hypothetical protein